MFILAPPLNTLQKDLNFKTTCHGDIQNMTVILRKDQQNNHTLTRCINLKAVTAEIKKNSKCFYPKAKKRKKKLEHMLKNVRKI